VLRTVVVVDDNASFRAVVRSLLENGAYCVIGEADTAAGALEAAIALRPDIVLLDIHLPDGDGFEVAEQLSRTLTDTAVILCSAGSRDQHEPQLVDCSARGFVAKADLSVETIDRLVGPQQDHT